MSEVVDLSELKDRYLSGLRILNYSECTLYNRLYDLDLFLKWCDTRGLSDPRDISKPVLERYQSHIYHYRKKDGDPLSVHTQHRHLASVRLFFKWISQENYIPHNPASELILPKLGKRLPRNILNTEKVESILNGIDVSKNVGVRNRAILETLYSTGMRRGELANLQVGDVDVHRGTVMIRDGKGAKDRVVPIGERALMWVEKYLTEVRYFDFTDYDRRKEPLFTLFSSGRNKKQSSDKSIGAATLSDLCRKLLRKFDVNKGACHIFRHTAATLMLENGADVRFIQELLGHEELSSTQIYTQVSIGKLKEVHTKTHPAKMNRTKK